MAPDRIDRELRAIKTKLSLRLWKASQEGRFMEEIRAMEKRAREWLQGDHKSRASKANAKARGRRNSRAASTSKPKKERGVARAPRRKSR